MKSLFQLQIEVQYKTAPLTVSLIHCQSMVCPVLWGRKATVHLTLVSALTEPPVTSLEASLDASVAHTARAKV